MAPKAIVITTALLVGVHHGGLVGALIGQGVGTLVVYPVIVRLSRRYGAWDPLHDLMFALIAMVFGGLALWLHWPEVAALTQVH